LSALDCQDTQLPRRQIIANLCPFGYRGPYCGYTGIEMFDADDNPVTDPALNVCAKTLKACKKRIGATNMLNFGGWFGRIPIGTCEVIGRVQSVENKAQSLRIISPWRTFGTF
jgi:lambda family phage minor tail protein L